jgi:predicted DNA-binding transcriptional regulator AlpA
LADALDARPDPQDLAVKYGLTLATAIAPLLRISDLQRILACDRRTIERMRAAGKLPPPDLHIGRSPRWREETIRAWIEGGGK